MKYIIPTLLFCFTTTLAFSQINYIQKAEEQVRTGNYEEAVKMYELAINQSPQDEGLKNKILLYSKLNDEFKALNDAIALSNPEEAKRRLENIKMIDGANPFIATKAEQIDALNRKKGQAKATRSVSKFFSIFWGNQWKHEAYGGFHSRLGALLTDVNEFQYKTGNIYPAANLSFSYTHFKSFPFTILAGVHYGTHRGVYADFGYSLISFRKFFYIEACAGYAYGKVYATKTNLLNERVDATLTTGGFYAKARATLMFHNSGGGGLSYSYTYPFNQNPWMPTHEISYVFGTKPTKYVAMVAFVGGLIGGLAYLKSAK